MDEQVDQLADLLQWVVDDERAGTGHYAWRHDAPDPDAKVVGFLVNHYRTSTTALGDVLDRLQTAERELQARTDAERVAEVPGQLELPPGRPVVDVPLPDHVVVTRPGEQVVPRPRTDPPGRP